MDDLLTKVIDETNDQDMKRIAQSIADLDLSPEEMEKNLISDGYFILDKKYDN
jgi:hypothetical protein